MEEMDLGVAGAIADIREMLLRGAVGMITNQPWKEADPTYPRLPAQERERLVQWLEAHRVQAEAYLADDAWEPLKRLLGELGANLVELKRSTAFASTIESDALSQTLGCLIANTTYVLDARRASS